MKATYTCDQDFDVVPRFVNDFVNGRLDVPMATTLASEHTHRVAELVKDAIASRLTHRNRVDNTDFEVRRVDDSGLLLLDPDRGTRFLPWSACEKVLLAANGGKYDPGNRDENSTREFLCKKLPFEWDRQIFSLLIAIGALVECKSDGGSRFVPSDLIGMNPKTTLP